MLEMSHGEAGGETQTSDQENILKRPITRILMSLCLLASCDPQKISELEEGISTQADVQQRFGEPAAIYKESNGDSTLEYPRQPAGQTNYMISTGPDGKMTSLRQVLTPTNFARITPGLQKSQVRRLLGRLAKVRAYALKEEEVWDWRFADGQQSQVFSVTFDKYGVVRSTAVTVDPKEVGQVS